MACMLTTKDNPFNPFTNYDEWLAFDEEKGYNCNAFLARIANFSDEFDQKAKEDSIEAAIDEIIKYDKDLFDLYRKVTK